MTKWENPPDAVWVWGKYGTYQDTYCHAEEIKQEEFEIPVTKYVRADRLTALEAQLAEAKGKLNEIACWSQSQGLLWWQVKAREALSALEATPPAPKVTEAMVEQAKREVIDALISADQVWADYGSGFRVHFSFPANSDKMWVVERINTARAITAAQEEGR